MFLYLVCATTNDTNTTKLEIGDLEVPNPNMDCVFPFTYNGTEHTNCTNDGLCSSCFWCGTQYNVTDEDGWGMCEEKCPKEWGMLFLDYVFALI